MSTEENKAVVRRLFDAINNGLEAMSSAREDVFAPSMVCHVPGGQTVDYEAYAQFDQMMFAAFSDIQFTFEDLIAEGDKVVVRYTARSTHKGEFQGIPATGKSVSVTGIDIFRLANGKIVEMWVEFDQLGQLRQLGVIPTPGEGGS
ncbi:MAG: ester cyclase [Chloroflexi bacterium]|nr:ester cyclase [Chloroflexota bacterium]